MKFIFTHAKLVKLCVLVENGTGLTALNARHLYTVHSTGLMLPPSNFLLSLISPCPSALLHPLLSCKSVGTIGHTKTMELDIHFLDDFILVQILHFL
jgi:hypothetical protein